MAHHQQLNLNPDDDRHVELTILRRLADSAATRQEIHWTCEDRVHETITGDRIEDRLEVLWARGLIEWAFTNCTEGKFAITADGRTVLRLLDQHTDTVAEQYHWDSADR